MLTLLLSTALAASNEINVEAGWLGSPTDAWETFSDAGVYGSGGLRIGYALHPNLAVIAGWQHGETGMSVVSYDATNDYYDEEFAFQTGFTGNQVTLGVKADTRITAWLRPYVTVQGDLLLATARFDDDPSQDDNPGQIAVHGFTGGVLATGGLDFPIELGHSGVAVAPYAEFGYGWLAPMQLGTMGEVAMRGFTGRTGIGFRF